MDPLVIDPARLEQQAADADTAAQNIATAQSAVSSMNLGGGAFGMMCAFLVPPAMGVTTVASSLMSQAKGMLEREAQALRDTATDFVACDEAQEARMRQLDTGYDPSARYHQ